MSMPVGKLPPEILGRMLKEYITFDERVRVGPSIGEDAAAIDMGDRYLLLKTDPITFVAEDIGTYTVRVNANDIATMGGKPLWMLASVLLPEKNSSTELAEDIFRQLAAACRDSGVALCGGHTEITAGIDKVIVVGAMVGEVEKDRLVTTGGAMTGDDIILTKAVAVEGVSIIARLKENDLKPVFGAAFVQKCKEFVETPGISILKEAEIALRHGDVHSMHDPTEGGLATGLFEIATAADVGLIVEEEKIPVYQECLALCGHYKLDPLGLIASGSLLICVNPRDTDNVLEALRDNGIDGSKIGKILPKGQGLQIRKGGELAKLPVFKRDELTKILG